MFCFYYDFRIYVLIYPDTCRKPFVVAVTSFERGISNVKKCITLCYFVVVVFFIISMRMDLFYEPFVSGTKTELF